MTPPSGDPSPPVRARITGLRLASGVLAGAAFLAACHEEGPAPPDQAGTEPSRADLLFDPTIERPEWMEEERSLTDPTKDDWRSEVLADVAKHRLQELFGHLVAGETEAAQALLADDFEGTSSLRPADAAATFEREGAQVRRGGIPAERRPASALPELARELLAPFADLGQPHLFLKIIDVEIRSAEEFDTTAIVHLSTLGERGGIQQNLEVTTGWRVVGADEDASVRSLAVTDFQEVGVQGPLFADVTDHVFGDVPRYHGEFLRGISDFWFRTDVLMGRPMMGMQGIAVGDVDQDGLEDVYVLQQAGLPNRLFLKTDDGRVRDATASSRLGFLETTRSALILDFDGDGDQDVAASVGSSVVFAFNDGRTVFQELVARPLPEPAEIYTMCAADPDRDGDLDLYACRWSYNRGKGVPSDPPLPFHDANNGPPNAYLRQDGPREYVDATAEVGLDRNNTRFSYAALWEDLDSDGDLDLYVANDFGRNNLYRNEDGHFRDVAGEAGAEDKSSGMGVVAGDYDLDGDMDLYVTNMFSSAGRRIVPQYRYRDGSPEDLLDVHLRFARGNSLLRNNGDGTFEDTTETARVAIAGWGWGSKFVDFDNDGREDLYCPNGYFTGSDPEDL